MSSKPGRENDERVMGYMQSTRKYANLKCRLYRLKLFPRHNAKHRNISYMARMPVITTRPHPLVRPSRDRDCFAIRWESSAVIHSTMCLASTLAKLQGRCRRLVQLTDNWLGLKANYTILLPATEVATTDCHGMLPGALFSS